MTLKEQLQKAIVDSGLSLNALSKAAGVPYMALHGLANYDRAITIDTAGKLCAALGLELRPVGRKGR
jgi:plasmid maintenance system antidote protein VapI